jgi:hypothetical protein
MSPPSGKNLLSWSQSIGLVPTSCFYFLLPDRHIVLYTAHISRDILLACKSFGRMDPAVIVPSGDDELQRVLPTMYSSTPGVVLWMWRFLIGFASVAPNVLIIQLWSAACIFYILPFPSMLNCRKERHRVRLSVRSEFCFSILRSSVLYGCETWSLTVREEHKLRVKNGVFWVVTPCGSCENRRFVGTWRLLHQGDKKSVN